jgi:hypothetical protein
LLRQRSIASRSPSREFITRLVQQLPAGDALTTRVLFFTRVSPGDDRPMGRATAAADIQPFWTGESICEVGNSVTIVVIPLVAIDTLHTSTLIVTLLTAMAWLPWAIIGIPAGAWVDRLPPRPVMLASDAISVAVYASVHVAA